MMYYVIKHTQEDEGKTQVIRPHEDYKAAVMDYHREIAETLVYDTVRILGVMLVNEYNSIIEQFRYERPDVAPAPEVIA